MDVDDGGTAGDGVAAMLRGLGATPHLATRWEPGRRTLWVDFAPEPRPCFTPDLVDSVLRLADAMAASRKAPDAPARPVVEFVVVGSAVPGTFGMGGDLALFVDAIERGDAAALELYGERGTTAMHALVDGFGADAVTVAAVDGKALGGGFEAARCCDLVVATPGSTFQLPEVRFGLHPGNGAMSVMSRRTDLATMRRLVLHGERIDAREAASLGLVDHLADGGEEVGTAAARVVDGLRGRHRAALALHRGFHEANGTTLASMLAETRRWARAAASQPPEALAAMRTIVAMQDRAAERSRRDGGRTACR